MERGDRVQVEGARECPDNNCRFRLSRENELQNRQSYSITNDRIWLCLNGTEAD